MSTDPTIGHTPTPWVVRGSEVVSFAGGRYRAADCDDHKAYTIDHEGKANAALIVRAVNAHAALVEALEACAADYINPQDVLANWEHIADRFYRETGYLRPGKDPAYRVDSATYEERIASWNKWCDANRTRLADLITSAIKLAQGES